MAEDRSELLKSVTQDLLQDQKAREKASQERAKKPVNVLREEAKVNRAEKLPYDSSLTTTDIDIAKTQRGRQAAASRRMKTRKVGYVSTAGQFSTEASQATGIDQEDKR